MNLTSVQKTLLIVDDDPDDVQLFCEAVADVNQSFHCFSAPNGEKALQLLETAIVKPDFIFLDLNMPRMNGRQLLQQLKKVSQFVHIPVVIYTTSKIKTDIEDVLRLGAVAFITKPSRLEDLVKAVSTVLAGKWELANSFS
jgi:CheY-like chemotaxis protein